MPTIANRNIKFDNMKDDLDAPRYIVRIVTDNPLPNMYGTSRDIGHVRKDVNHPGKWEIKYPKQALVRWVGSFATRADAAETLIRNDNRVQARLAELARPVEDRATEAIARIIERANGIVVSHTTTVEAMHADFAKGLDAGYVIEKHADHVLHSEQALLLAKTTLNIANREHTLPATLILARLVQYFDRKIASIAESVLDDAERCMSRSTGQWSNIIDDAKTAGRVQARTRFLLRARDGVCGTLRAEVAALHADPSMF